MALPRRMDGRDFGPPRSVHGPPPPLLSGLAMDSHRVGAATAGRLPASGLPGPLPPGKYMAGLNLHPHPGKCPTPCSPPLVPSGFGGGMPGKYYWACSRAFATGVRHYPLSRRIHGVAGSFSFRGGETLGLGRGNPGGAGVGVRGSAAASGAPGSPKAHFSAAIGVTGDEPNSRIPAAEAGLEFSKSGGEKNKPALHPLMHPFPELESIYWQTPLPAPVGPGFRF